MELRAAALALLLVCAIIFPATEGYMPHCCVKTSKYVPRYILRSRGRYEIQTDKGACDIPAVILYLRSKKYCIDPKFQYALDQIHRKKISRRGRNPTQKQKQL